MCKQGASQKRLDPSIENGKKKCKNETKNYDKEKYIYYTISFKKNFSLFLK
jgi:hypothetical protein